MHQVANFFWNTVYNERRIIAVDRVMTSLVSWMLVGHVRELWLNGAP